MSVVPYIVEQEVFNVRKDISLFHKRENIVPVTVYKVLVRCFILVRLCEFHSVFFSESFNLAVAEHRKSRHCNHQCADTKIFVIFSELGNCGVFVRIVHKVYIAF